MGNRVPGSMHACAGWCDDCNPARRDAVRVIQEGPALTYYTNVGPMAGPLCSKHGFLAIKVFGADHVHRAIGVALADGQDANGLTLWRLTIGEADLPGTWVVLDRVFRPIA